MDRRGFLKGAFGGVAAGGIIIAASLPDTKAFIEHIKEGDPVGATASFGHPENIGEVVFNHKGETIGIIEKMDISRSTINVTPMGSEYSVVVPGVTTYRFTVVSGGVAAVPSFKHFSNGHGEVFGGR